MEYASTVASSTLTSEETYVSYMMFLIPKLCFPLPALTLTEQQCN